MGILKTKQIRFECDNINGIYHSEVNMEGILDQAGHTYQECYNVAIKYFGWRKIKGKWYCPKCADQIMLTNLNK